MQRTADFHHHVANPGFPCTNGLLKHAATFDAAVDMFDAHPSPSEPPMLAPCWQWVRRGVGDALVMDTAWTGLTQEEDAQGPIGGRQRTVQYPSRWSLKL
jgi:hypothetical protein